MKLKKFLYTFGNDIQINLSDILKEKSDTKSFLDPHNEQCLIKCVIEQVFELEAFQTCNLWSFIRERLQNYFSYLGNLHLNKIMEGIRNAKKGKMARDEYYNKIAKVQLRILSKKEKGNKNEVEMLKCSKLVCTVFI